MKTKLVNVAGLYTQEQWDKLQERTKQLWEALNSAHAFMSTHALPIKAMTEEGGMDYDSRMSMIRTYADEMADRAGRSIAVLHDTNCLDVTQW